jgi:predicted AAA+ superfamily ATPase
MENWAFSELYKRLPLTSIIRFWRSKAGGEVDFVIEEAGKIMAMEVKAADLERPGLSRSARSFIDAYHPEKFMILNPSLETTLTIDNCQIDFQTPVTLMDKYGQRPIYLDDTSSEIAWLSVTMKEE